MNIREGSPKLPQELAVINKMQPQRGKEAVLKNAVTCPISINVIEVWLNETLREAEFYKLRNTLRVQRAKGSTVALQDYLIDRVILGASGLSESTIDRLYRSLFVYTVGFYSQIKDMVSEFKPFKSNKEQLTTKHDSQASIFSSVWRVFQIIIEYVQATDYRFQMMRVLDENFDNIKAQEVHYQQLLQIEQDKFNQQASRIEDLEGQVLRMRQEVKEARISMANYDKILREQKQNQDAETIMRIKFEEKMTYLHSQNRATTQAAQIYAKQNEEKEQDLNALHELAEERLKSVEEMKIQLAHENKLVDNLRVKLEAKQASENELNNILAESRVSQTKAEVQSRTLRVFVKNYEEQIRSSQKKITEMNNELMRLKNENKELVEDGEKKAIQITELSQDNNLLKEKYTQVQSIHDLMAGEFEQTKAEKEQIKKDLIVLREDLQENKNQKLLLEIEVSDLFERLELKNIELETKTELLNDARIKINQYDQIMYNLHENEKQIRFEADLINEKLKNSQALNVSHRENNVKLENNLREANRKYQAVKNKQSDQILAMESMEKKAEDRIGVLTQMQQQSQRDSKFYQMEFIAEQKKATKLEEHALKLRQTITTQLGKMNYLDSEVKVRDKEVEQLKKKVAELEEETNSTVNNTENLQRNLEKATSDYEAIREIKDKEIQLHVSEFEQYRHTQMINWMAAEDALSAAVRAEQIRSTVEEERDLALARAQTAESERDIANSLRFEMQEKHEKLKVKCDEQHGKCTKLSNDLSKSQRVAQSQAKELLSLQEKFNKTQKDHLEVLKVQTTQNIQLKMAQLKIKQLEKVKVTYEVACGRTIDYNEKIWPGRYHSPVMSSRARERKLEFFGTEVHFVDKNNSILTTSNMALKGDDLLFKQDETFLESHPFNCTIDDEINSNSAQNEFSIKKMSNVVGLLKKGSQMGPGDQSRPAKRVLDNLKKKSKFMSNSPDSKSRTKKKQSNARGSDGVKPSRRSSLFQALLKSGQEQFPYSMKFRSIGTQCHKVSRASVVNQYQDEIKAQIEEQMQMEAFRAKKEAENRVKTQLQAVIDEKEKVIEQLKSKEKEAKEREDEINKLLYEARKKEAKQLLDREIQSKMQTKKSNKNLRDESQNEPNQNQSPKSNQASKKIAQGRNQLNVILQSDSIQTIDGQQNSTTHQQEVVKMPEGKQASYLMLLCEAQEQQSARNGQQSERGGVLREQANSSCPAEVAYDTFQMDEEQMDGMKMMPIECYKGSQKQDADDEQLHNEGSNSKNIISFSKVDTSLTPEPQDRAKSALDQIFSSEKPRNSLDEQNEVVVSRITLMNHLQNKYDNHSSSKRSSLDLKGRNAVNQAIFNEHLAGHTPPDKNTDSRPPTNQRYSNAPLFSKSHLQNNTADYFFVNQLQDEASELKIDDQYRLINYTNFQEITEASQRQESGAQKGKTASVSPVRLIDRKKDLVCQGDKVKQSKPTIKILTSNPKKNKQSYSLTSASLADMHVNKSKQTIGVAKQILGFSRSGRYTHQRNSSIQSNDFVQPGSINDSGVHSSLIVRGDKTNFHNDPFVLTQYQQHDYGEPHNFGNMTAQNFQSKMYASTHTQGKFFKGGLGPGSGRSVTGGNGDIKPLLKKAFEKR